MAIRHRSTGSRAVKPLTRSLKIWNLLFPLGRGDISRLRAAELGAELSSPRERGSFYAGRRLYLCFRVFPARAGIFLTGHQGTGQHWGLPRVCGDLSKTCSTIRAIIQSSPRKRGSFWPLRGEQSRNQVFPARAGIFLEAFSAGLLQTSLTRVGRDRSWMDFFHQVGCQMVFPANAGIFPSSYLLTAFGISLPRACGDLSYCGFGTVHSLLSSSHTRGSF